MIKVDFLNQANFDDFCLFIAKCYKLDKFGNIVFLYSNNIITTFFAALFPKFQGDSTPTVFAVKSFKLKLSVDTQNNTKFCFLLKSLNDRIAKCKKDKTFIMPFPPNNEEEIFNINNIPKFSWIPILFLSGAEAKEISCNIDSEINNIKNNIHFLNKRNTILLNMTHNIENAIYLIADYMKFLNGNRDICVYRCKNFKRLNSIYGDIILYKSE